jgi:hypothetical protein
VLVAPLLPFLLKTHDNPDGIAGRRPSGRENPPQSRSQNGRVG